MSILGAVTFFSYWGPDGNMDPEQLTEHSGCPVKKGEKWIATFWMREGVSTEFPHTVFDPRGNRIDMILKEKMKESETNTKTTTTPTTPTTPNTATSETKTNTQSDTQTQSQSAEKANNVPLYKRFF